MKELFPSRGRAAFSSRSKGSAWGKVHCGSGAESEAPCLGGFRRSFLQESKGLLQSWEQGESEYWILLLLVEYGVIPDSAGSLPGGWRKHVALEFKLYGRHNISPVSPPRGRIGRGPPKSRPGPGGLPLWVVAWTVVSVVLVSMGPVVLGLLVRGARSGHVKFFNRQAAVSVAAAMVLAVTVTVTMVVAAWL